MKYTKVKALELIRSLTRLVEQHGNLPIEIDKENSLGIEDFKKVLRARIGLRKRRHHNLTLRREATCGLGFARYARGN